ncbi:2-amino-4-hydroxy-6-hydroxymethyldihydropteridine diphosphokinase [Endothiovibrio diazotrophicus]
MARVFVSVGSNIDREHNIRSALDAMEAAFGELELSTVYETVAVGFEGDNFFNLVVAFDTGLALEQVTTALREIEQAHRRERGSKRFAPRTLDLDLLLFDDVVADEPELPRGEIVKYAFVLKPLAELAPTLRHPTLGTPYAELWQRFDPGEQRLWPVDFRRSP